MICGSGGSKSRLAKAAGAEPPGQRRNEKLHAEAHFQVKCTKHIKTHHALTTFWKLGCGKMARSCGGKHIFKSKCEKTCGVRGTFGGIDVEKVHAVLARSTFRSEHSQNTSFLEHFWTFGCRKSVRQMR